MGFLLVLAAALVLVYGCMAVYLYYGFRKRFTL